MEGSEYLEDALTSFKKYKKLADDAVSQITDEQLFLKLDAESNNIAVIIKHMSGNMISRWKDFLTTDGEKPDRNRDSEFVITESDSVQEIMRNWENGWKQLFITIKNLKDSDLNKIVYIRGEKLIVFEAINRQLTHYAYHVGQIVLLAKHFTGSNWCCLSIPRGKSSEFHVSKDGVPYKVKDMG
ncbi:MAG: DUF1572 family protein [Planctomycetes bacterium]|nr:DUF1572 family protein [Planctomycetota bacterium]